MSRSADEIADDLVRDLEFLSCLAEDLAQRIPEGRLLAATLASLREECDAIAREIRAGWRRPRLTEWMHQTRFLGLQGRVDGVLDALSRERDGALVLVDGAVWQHTHNRACTRTLVRNFHLAHSRAEALRLALVRLHAQHFGPGMNLLLDGRLAGDLADNSELRPVDRLARDEPGVHPGRQALRLVELVLRVLPPDQRARYGEEWRAELYDLAEMNGSYGAQLLYVLRQFDQVFVLRQELHRPSRRSVKS